MNPINSTNENARWKDDMENWCGMEYKAKWTMYSNSAFLIQKKREYRIVYVVYNNKINIHTSMEHMDVYKTVGVKADKFCTAILNVKLLISIDHILI